MITVRTRSLHS